MLCSPQKARIVFEQHFVVSAEFVCDVLLDVAVASHTEAFALAADVVARAEGLSPEPLVSAIEERERLAGTGIAPGVIMPHAELGPGGASHVLYLRPRSPLTHAQYGEVVLLVFLFVRAGATPDAQQSIRSHVRALADEELVAVLAGSATPEEFCSLLP